LKDLAKYGDKRLVKHTHPNYRMQGMFDSLGFRIFVSALLDSDIVFCLTQTVDITQEEVGW